MAVPAKKGSGQMRKRSLLALAGVTATALLAAACSSSSGTGGGGSASGGGDKPYIGVILPDTQSSARWAGKDQPYLEAAFKAAGVKYDIQNAQGDKSKFQSIADGMLNEGVNVLMIVNLDSQTGAAVESKAASQGVKTIDYDRLTLGGGASYYVSFDNVAVGTTIGDGLVKCLKADGKNTGNVVELNGSPTDNNATLFKQGYDKQIRAAGYKIIADQSVPDWNNTQAGTIFDQIYTKNKGNIDGVAAANDGLGGAVISVLSRNGVAGKIPVTGQDATDEGLQRVLQGTQCMTAFKDIKKEAAAASSLAILLAKGNTSEADAQASGSVTDTQTNKPVKSVLLKPEGIFLDNIKDVTAAGFTTAANLCTTTQLKTLCTKYGIS
jgi:D-xylose transport system substrate-binding protein